MRKIDLFKMSLKNFKNSKLNGKLSILAVCVGIASVSLILETGKVAQSAIETQLSQISKETITIQAENIAFDKIIVDELRNNNKIAGVMPYIFEYSTIYAKNTEMDAVVCGIDNNFTNIFDTKILYGEISDNNFTINGNKVIIDDILANKLYKRTNIIGKQLQINIGGIIEYFEIIGVISSQKAGFESVLGQALPEIVYVSCDKINELYGDNMVYNLAVTCKEGASSNNISQKIQRTLRIYDSNNNYSVENIGSYAEMANKVLAIISLLLSGIGSISLVVGGIGIMNSMLANVENRTGEIGVYMALGTTKSDIVKSFIFEAVIISCIGGFLGITTSGIILWIVNYFLGTTIIISFKNILVCFAGALVCGVLFGIIPAQKAGKLNPIDAIRWE